MTYIGKTREPAYFFHASQETVELARRLRRNMTNAEKTLWEKLRRKNILGVRFRRQHPIEFYIADFYCHEAKLVIEVDGLYHLGQGQKLYDGNRSAEIDRFDIKVIRFTNEEVEKDLGNVLQQIKKEVTERIPKRL